jgi:moderate conductance mechanosensitive channel
MSSPFLQLYNFTVPNALHLAGILLVALLFLRGLRRLANLLVYKGAQANPATGSAAHLKATQAREQQTRELAELVYDIGSKLIWAAALLTALPEFGISMLPGVALGATAVLGLALGTHTLIKDAAAGICIFVEDQFAVGDTIQADETTGRVEQLTLRRTILRDTRGALVTIANGEIRSVSNLSRDWSQAFVDIAVAAESGLEKSLAALESAAAELRSDAAWSQTLVDGPRVLGLQGHEGGGLLLRLQVRTAPTRQEEVCRELRRRIQIEMQKRGIALAGAPQ